MEAYYISLQNWLTDSIQISAGPRPPLRLAPTTICELPARVDTIRLRNNIIFVEVFHVAKFGKVAKFEIVAKFGKVAKFEIVAKKVAKFEIVLARL